MGDTNATSPQLNRRPVTFDTGEGEARLPWETHILATSPQQKLWYGDRTCHEIDYHLRDPAGIPPPTGCHWNWKTSDYQLTRLERDRPMPLWMNMPPAPNSTEAFRRERRHSTMAKEMLIATSPQLDRSFGAVHYRFEDATGNIAKNLNKPRKEKEWGG